MYPYLPKLEADNLFFEAEKVSKNAYSPYSHFNVGAAVLTHSGETFLGVNVENASYDSVHAERVAIGSCFTAGHTGKDIKAIAVYADADSVPPCGFCRQFIIEFGEEIIIIFKFNGKIEQRYAKEMLPFKFVL